MSASAAKPGGKRRAPARPVPKRKRAPAPEVQEAEAPPKLWAPNPGPQKDAFETKADFTFYGGAAGGGKTDLLLGLALSAHRRSILFRREYAQLKAVIERAREIIGEHGRYTVNEKLWRLPEIGRYLEFGAVQRAGDERKFQGRPHDLKAFDELPHFTEQQFRFLCGWLRTTERGQRCRVVAAGNPPTDAEGDWVIRFWGPWLDPQHPNPAKPGELRWFAVLDGEEVEVENGRPFRHKGEVIRAKSRTFVPARVEDNPYYMATDYVSTLQALPEPLRSMLLQGRFDAGREDNPWQVIPSGWVKAAQQRWEEGKRPEDAPMTAVGVDVAQGGRDETVLSPRWDNWFGKQRCVAGADTPDGPTVAALVMSALRDGAQVNIDLSGGWGGSAFDHLRTAGVPIAGLNGAERSEARDRSGRLGFFNRRAEWWWRFREALDPDYGEGIALPPDPRLYADLCAARWVLTSRGIKIEDKDEIIKRIGRSPDRGEAAVYSLAADGPNWRRKRGGPARSTDSGYDPLRW